MPPTEAILDQLIENMTDPTKLKKLLQDTRETMLRMEAERDEARKITEDVAQQRTDTTLELGAMTTKYNDLSEHYAKAVKDLKAMENERDDLSRVLKAVRDFILRGVPDCPEKTLVLKDLDRLNGGTTE